MVPILSRRSIIILVLGLVAGLLIGLGYWIISPAFSASIDPETGQQVPESGLLDVLGIKPDGPFESKVNIQVVNPGSEYEELNVLQQIAEYYTAKHASLPFFEFLSEISAAGILDSRLILAHRRSWPSAPDRFHSDLRDVERIEDPLLREFTAAALGASIPVVLGGHSFLLLGSESLGLRFRRCTFLLLFCQFLFHLLFPFFLFAPSSTSGFPHLPGFG